ncbi:MAG: hypothetical protein B6245_15675 [Desulfobacteraceae bacterium 4572_88]|nr:MAG: hypothetical protein B6245_15675 [Desulfobacteraceae bacterium 4572_88]
MGAWAAFRLLCLDPLAELKLGKEKRAMREIGHIIDAYQKGDDEERLHMFLEHRSLRGEFMRTDHRNRGGEGIECPPRQKKTGRLRTSGSHLRSGISRIWNAI